MPTAPTAGAHAEKSCGKTGLEPNVIRQVASRELCTAGECHRLAYWQMAATWHENDWCGRVASRMTSGGLAGCD